MKPAWSNIQKAQHLLRSHFLPTRLLFSPSLSRNKHAPVYLKLETELPTGSFKVRGAVYALRAEMEHRTVTEVVASSTGNHGAAVAYAARLAGIAASIFLPHKANPVKRHHIQELGAKIVEKGKDISEALEHAKEHASRTGAFLLDDATNPDVPAGTATIGCEIIQQLPNVIAIWVPIGDTALIRGVAGAAKHLRSGVRIVGVQAERAPSYYLSWKRGVPVSTDTCDTIADGLATRSPIYDNVVAIRELVDEIRLVSEEQMLTAIRHLRTRDQVLAEPAGAATTAAWLADPDSSANGPSALLVTGANISEEVHQQVVGRIAIA